MQEEFGLRRRLFSSRSLSSRGERLPTAERGEPGVQDVSQGIAEEGESEYSQAQGYAGEDGEPWRYLEIFAGSLLKHTPPRGVRRRHAQAQEAERCFRYHGLGQVARGQHNDGRQAVGERVAGPKWTVGRTVFEMWLGAL